MNVSSVLRSGPLRALVAAQVISTTGSQMTWVALPWFVLLTTGSATKTTFMVASEVIGLALLGLPGGGAISLGDVGTVIGIVPPGPIIEPLIGKRCGLGKHFHCFGVAA